MENNIKKDKIQREAYNAWLLNNKKGTCEIITGLGKTFIALHALCSMPINDNKIHLFLAESKERKKDLLEDIKNYKIIFNIDILKLYNLKFYCYQTTYKWKNKEFGLVIADEIHDAMSPAYSKFFINNKYDAIIGLSATINRTTLYNLEDKKINKGIILDSIAPVCYRYSIQDGQKDNTVRRLNIYIIQNKLDNVKKYIESGNIKKRFYQTELGAYTYWDKEHKKSWFIQDPELKEIKINITSKKRTNILYNLESKIDIVKKLLLYLNSKTIIFSNSLDSLEKVTDNIVSSRNSDTQNNIIRNKFDNDEINVIGSFKKLKQGANLKNLDNCIIMSYYGIDKDMIQRIGRLRDNNTVGNVFIIVTLNTQEEVWLNKIFDNITSLNLIYCPDVNYCINKILNEKKITIKD